MKKKDKIKIETLNARSVTEIEEELEKMIKAKRGHIKNYGNKEERKRR